MELVIAGAVNIASFAYIGANVRRYFNFMKFRDNKYIDKFHLLEGQITAPSHHKSFVHAYKGQNVDNLIISKLQIEVGKDKIGTSYRPVNTGKQVIWIPQQYHYTDWKTTHTKVTKAVDIELLNKPVKLLFGEFQCHYTQNYNIKETKTHLLGDLFKLLDTHKINYHYGDKVIMHEEYIQQGDPVAIVGEYQNNNKEMIVKHIGSIDQVLEGVKSEICHFNGIGIGVACCLICITIVFVMAEEEIITL